MIQSPKDLVPRFFDETAKTYERVVAWTTFGKDRYWKKKIVNKINNVNSVLDLACGTGILTRMIASKLPQTKIVGIDISKNYLAQANKNPFPNISYIHEDAEKMDLKQKFDCICSSYIPKYCNSEILIERCIAHLHSGGSIILHDFVYPNNKLINAFWRMYFLLLNCIGNFIPPWKYAFTELPKLIQKTKWVEQYKQELEKHGFTVTQQNLTWNCSVILHAEKISNYKKYQSSNNYSN